jgi:hypothetical protein
MGFFFLKTSVIETINDGLKNLCQAKHTRHRAMHNCIVNLIPDAATDRTIIPILIGTAPSSPYF